MKLPGGDIPIVDERKIVDYLLSPAHPIGRHKAKVFSSALGLTVEGAFLLSAALKAAAERYSSRLSCHSSSMIKLFDTVTLLVDRPDLGLSAGQSGAVVLVHDDDGYEVEFLGPHGETVAVAALTASDITAGTPVVRRARR